MRYNDRVKTVTSVESDDGWGSTEPVISDWLPCQITGVKSEMNMGVFGKYTSSAREIHFKNKVPTMDYVLLGDGVKRKPSAILQARKNTVVIVEVA